jgi:FKBP-type peptidyl-prolyl cis-trans isomerase
LDSTTLTNEFRCRHTYETRETTKTADTLTIKEIKIGAGKPVTGHGQWVTVHYTGRLAFGTELDSSRRRHEPFTFALGVGAVIPGLELGIIGMRVGGIRRFLVAPGLAYGAHGAAGTIPPNATLEFEVELLDVRE